MEAIILAGGFGTRLQQVLDDKPKSMAPVNGRPFLEYLLDYLNTEGVRHVVLSVGYKRDIIMNYFGTSYRDIKIDYAIEEVPMGTGGGIRMALWKIDGKRAFAMNGDSMFRLDLQKLCCFHLQVLHFLITIWIYLLN
jgi:D-glycero-alpha-D-manno-heptose 1-phosphate guanylyltransferase